MHERLTAQQDDVIPETSGIHALLVSLLGALAANTWAQGYPAKPVRYIMPTTGASEVVGRLIAQDLSPMIVVVHPSFPAKSIGDLVRLARAKPGAINYSSAGVGTSTFLAAELFKSTADVKLVEVPYRGGGPAVTAIVSGEVPVYFAPIATVLPFVRQGRLRALAVCTTKRMPMLPEYPTVAESGYPGYEASNWHGLVVPAKTPKEIITAIHAAAVAALNRPDLSKRIQDLGMTPIGDQPGEFAEFLKADIEKWRKIVREKGLTAA